MQLDGPGPTYKPTSSVQATEPTQSLAPSKPPPKEQARHKHPIIIIISPFVSLIIIMPTPPLVRSNGPANRVDGSCYFERQSFTRELRAVSE
jgi:hypothetical protein